jgi:hypothetical protein
VTKDNLSLAMDAVRRYSDLTKAPSVKLSSEAGELAFAEEHRQKFFDKVILAPDDKSSAIHGPRDSRVLNFLATISRVFAVDVC